MDEEREEIKDGEIICKLDVQTIKEMKSLVDCLKACDEMFEALITKRAFLLAKRNKIWKKLADRYLLTKYKAYHVDLEEGVIKKGALD